MWSQSKAMLGTIGPVQRARVCDLRNFDPDRALAPTHRVPGRGISCNDFEK